MHSTHKTNIVFDFGGVLFDWHPHYLYRRFFDTPAATDAFLKEIGFSEWNLQQDQGRPFAEGVAELTARFPQHAGLIRAYDTYWETSLGGPIQATVDILAQLKRAGYPLYALSNWSHEKFALIRHRYAFLDWFEDILVSGEVCLVKPDERIFTLFLERIGRQAGDCLFIDDSPANIAAARRLGFKTVLFETPEQLVSALQQHGLNDFQNPLGIRTASGYNLGDERTIIPS